jgi:hypothetical protein
MSATLICAQFAIRIYAGNKRRGGVMASKESAGYQPVAWWFTKRRLGQELRNLYQTGEELPPQLLALIGKIEGKPVSSPEATG